jgi:phage terminase large subunit-like protein
MSDFAARLAEALSGDSWELKARPNQLLPVGDWSVCLFCAGRGWGKTKVLSETANSWSHIYQRQAIVAATAADCRDVMVEGESGILATAPNWHRPTYESTRRRVVWPNGAVAFLYSAEEPERLRGPQHGAALCDELGSWRVPETWDQLQFGLRLGRAPKIVVATTPRPTKLLRSLLAREGQGVIVIRGSSYENRANLAPGFFDSIVKKYEGTRLGRQELEAELLADVPGALWTLEMLDRCRRDRAPELQRIVVSIDPAVSSREGSDETGIIVAGKDERGHGYILEDLSGRYQPHQWSTIAVEAYRRHQADRIIAEVNQGGDLVESTVRMISADVPFTAIHASRGKFIRAEPVSALFEQNKVHLVGNFPHLEDQLTSFVPDLDRNRSGSPDRADSMVYALTELLVEQERYGGLLAFYESEAALARAGQTLTPETSTPATTGNNLLYAQPGGFSSSISET